MNNLVLAYLGDAVYELYVREFLIAKNVSKVKDLQKETTKYVSATAQANILEKLLNENILTSDEIDIVKRGRNAHSHQNKNVDIQTYKKATGFECLIGELYTKNKERLTQIMKEVLK